jgi:hypothetical protein
MWWLIPIGLRILGLIAAGASEEERDSRILWENIKITS